MPKRKRQNRHRQQQQHKRRRHRYRCWIEECPETHSAGNKEAVDVHLLITRVLLDDGDADADGDVDNADNDADNDGGVVVDADKNVDIDAVDADKNADIDIIDADNNVNVANNVDNVDIDAVKHDGSVKVPDMKPAPDNTTSTTATTIATTNTTTTTTTTPHISVQRHPLALQKVMPKHPRQPNFHHLPRGDCGDGILNPYASDVVHDKYWAQRHRLFRRFADGIQMDPQSWYSVTPEAIANHIAQKMTRNLSNLVILDAFAGVGGNAIAFARRPEVDLVVCVDTDVQKLYMAANNCRVYGIPTRKLLFVCADAVDILRLYGRKNANVADDKDDNGADDGHEKDADVADDNGADDNGADDKDADNGNVNPPNHNLSRNIQHNAQHTHGYTFVPFLASPTSTTSSTTTSSTTTSSTTTTFDILPKTVHAIFLSPPWGGSDYCNQRHFDPINDIQINDQTNGSDLLKLAVRALSKSWSKTSMKNRTPNHSTTSFVPNLAYFLPRNTNGWRLGQCIFDAALHSVEMEQNYLNQKLKTITAYLHAR